MNHDLAGEIFRQPERRRERDVLQHRHVEHHPLRAGGQRAAKAAVGGLRQRYRWSVGTAAQPNRCNARGRIRSRHHPNAHAVRWRRDRRVVACQGQRGTRDDCESGELRADLRDNVMEIISEQYAPITTASTLTLLGADRWPMRSLDMRHPAPFASGAASDPFVNGAPPAGGSRRAPAPTWLWRRFGGGFLAPQCPPASQRPADFVSRLHVVGGKTPEHQ